MVHVWFFIFMMESAGLAPPVVKEIGPFESKAQCEKAYEGTWVNNRGSYCYERPAS